MADHGVAAAAVESAQPVVSGTRVGAVELVETEM